MSATRLSTWWLSWENRRLLKSYKFIGSGNILEDCQIKYPLFRVFSTDTLLLKIELCVIILS